VGKLIEFLNDLSSTIGEPGLDDEHFGASVVQLMA
jgi:hypothetical protein